MNPGIYKYFLVFSLGFLGLNNSYSQQPNLQSNLQSNPQPNLQSNQQPNPQSNFNQPFEEISPGLPNDLGYSAQPLYLQPDFDQQQPDFDPQQPDFQLPYPPQAISQANSQSNSKANSKANSQQANSKQPRATNCQPSAPETNLLIKEIQNNKNLVKNLPECLKINRNFIIRLIEIDEDYFAFAAGAIRDDENFIKYLITQYPKILQYISPRLKKDKSFYSSILNSVPNALKYATPELQDDKTFMKKMIERDPKNFIYTSDRLKEDFDITMMTVKNSGEMLRYATNEMQANKAIAKAALSSFTPAINFVDIDLQKNPEIKKLARSVNYDYLENFTSYLKNNYGGLPIGPKGARGYRIVNRGKFHSKNEIINNTKEAKWELVYDRGQATGDYKIAIDSRNYPWKEYLKKNPQLIKEVEKFLLHNKIDQSTIDSLNLTSLWEVDSKPKTVVFELSLLRKFENKYLKATSVNITSLAVIARKEADKWRITPVGSVLDTNAEMRISMKSGYKRYKIWDIYKSNPNDANPKILFKIEDSDAEYFELFAKQPNGRYAAIFQGGGYTSSN